MKLVLRSRQLLSSSRLPVVPSVLLALAALAVGIGGYEHYHLWTQGYKAIPVVGTLFILNTIGSAALIVLLIARRTALFSLGSVALAAGALVSIVLSRNGGVFGFREVGYDQTAKIVIAAELSAIALVALTAALGVLRRRNGLRAEPHAVAA